MPTDALRSVRTGDGSRTLYDPDRDLHFRSTHGAVQESRHVFVDGTRAFEGPSPRTILELGFGAGTNFVETLRRRRECDSESGLSYHAVERDPVDADDLAFHDGPAGDLARRALATAHSGPSSPVRAVGAGGDVELILHLGEWSQFSGDLTADAIYYDPFGPKAEPESWTVECFAVARRHIEDDALLGTYSAASDVKRAMSRAGFAVATAEGPGRKREITFASPSADALTSYQILDLETDD